MAFYDKFVDRFQDMTEINNPAVSKAKVWKLLRAFKRKFFGEYDAIKLTKIYWNVHHDMVSKNS